MCLSAASVKMRPDVVSSEKFPKHWVGGEGREFASRNVEITRLHGPGLFLNGLCKLLCSLRFSLWWLWSFVPPAVTPCNLVEVCRRCRGPSLFIYQSNKRPSSINRKSGFGSSWNSRCVSAKITHSTCHVKNETVMEVTDRNILS